MKPIILVDPFPRTMELIFTKDNWNINQEIIVTGKDDYIIDGDIGSEIMISVDDVLSDITYRTVLPTSVIVINEDNTNDKTGWWS